MTEKPKCDKCGGNGTSTFHVVDADTLLCAACFEKSKGPRAWTAKEVRDKFLDHVWTMIRYWNENVHASTAREKLEGLAFNILTTIDGESAMLPAFQLILNPCPEDEEYSRKNGDNWYPSNIEIVWLHEHFHERRPK